MNKTQEPNAVYKETFEIFEKLNSTNKNAVCMAIQGIYLSQKNTEAACGKAQKDNRGFHGKLSRRTDLAGTTGHRTRTEPSDDAQRTEGKYVRK